MRSWRPVSSGVLTGNDFGNWTTATKSGVKFEDLDADAAPRGLAAGLAGPSTSATTTAKSTTSRRFAVTGGYNAYTIGIDPGTYNVREVGQTTGSSSSALSTCRAKRTPWACGATTRTTSRGPDRQRLRRLDDRHQSRASGSRISMPAAPPARTASQDCPAGPSSSTTTTTAEPRRAVSRSASRGPTAATPSAASARHLEGARGSPGWPSGPTLFERTMPEASTRGRSSRGKPMTVSTSATGRRPRSPIASSSRISMPTASPREAASRGWPAGPSSSTTTTRALDDGEPFGVTGADGSYTINGISPARGTCARTPRLVLDQLIPRSCRARARLLPGDVRLGANL